MDVGTPGSESGAMRRWGGWVIAAIAVPAVVALLTAPLGRAGVCSSGDGCRSWSTNVLAMPVTDRLWWEAAILAFAAVLVSWAVSARTRRPPAP